MTHKNVNIQNVKDTISVLVQMGVEILRLLMKLLKTVKKIIYVLESLTQTNYMVDKIQLDL